MVKSFFIRVGLGALFGFFIDLIEFVSGIVAVTIDHTSRVSPFDMRPLPLRFLFLGLLIGLILFVVDKCISNAFLQVILQTFVWIMIVVYMIVSVPSMISVMTPSIVTDLVVVIAALISMVAIIMQGILQVKKGK